MEMWATKCKLVWKCGTTISKLVLKCLYSLMVIVIRTTYTLFNLLTQLLVTSMFIEVTVHGIRVFFVNLLGLVRSKSVNSRVEKFLVRIISLLEWVEYDIIYI